MEKFMTRKEAKVFATKFVETMPKLSPATIAALEQLVQSPVWDGDLVSKEGRTELIRLGIAQRQRRDIHGLAINELTPEWKLLLLG